MVIYKTTNLVNGKFYVGKDKGNNNWYLGSGKILLYAIDKYGKANFKKDILEVCQTEEQLNEREIYWIKELNATDKTIGYNIAEGGQGGDLYQFLSPERLIETKQKISDGVKLSIKEGRMNHHTFTTETAKKANKIVYEKNKQDNFVTFTKKQNETKLNNGTHPSCEEMKKINSEGVKKFWKENPEIRKEIDRKNSEKRKGKKMIDVFIEKHGLVLGAEKYESWRTKMINSKKGKAPWNKKK